MKRFNWLLTGALFVSTFAGCKKKQEMAEHAPVWTADEKARIETVISQQLPFETFQSKMNISLQSGSKSFAVNGTFKLIRNERLQVSIQPFLGIEVVRAEFTNDSLKLMDRLNKRYVAESIVSYRESLPVDVRFETIQALFLNQLFVPGEPTFSINDFTAFRWRTENDGLLIGRLKNDDWFVLNFFLNPENLLSQTQVSSKSGAHIVDWRYERFQPLSGTSFPMKSVMTYRTDNDSKLKAELEFSRVELDKKMNMRFDIPASYSKIELSDLVRGLMKLQ
ncbi:MAG: DUF4292 domain-containing protein [Bacteroidales bacterium]